MSLNYLNFLCVLITVAPYRESSFMSPLSLFYPIPFRRRCRFPCSRHINARLLPPPHLHPPPCALSDPSHRSDSDPIAMYYKTVFWRRRMYSTIVNNPDSSLVIAAEVYIHLPSGFCCGSRPVSRLSTWSWNTPRALPMQGVTTQVLKSKINTACTTAVKKNMETRVSSPLPAEDSCHPIPHCPFLRQVPDHHQSVIVFRQYHPSWVLEGGHHIHGSPIGAE